MMEKRKRDPLSTSPNKRKARQSSASYSEITIKQEHNSEEDQQETDTHYYQSRTFFDESQMTFTLQDLADATDSKSATLISLSTASTVDSTQFLSTEDSVSDSATDHYNSDPSGHSEHSSELPDDEHDDDCDIKSECGLIIAGTANSLALEDKTQKTAKAFKFDQECLHLKCEWEGCNFESRFINEFISHVGQHTPVFALVYRQKKPSKVYLVCKWESCPFKTLTQEDMQQHVFFHAYHTKIKCLGLNAITRSGTTMCSQDGYTRNVIPAMSALVCAWDNCSETFINIQMYYDHIHYHCQDQQPGKVVKGGIRCLWSGCTNLYQNKSKLQDHMKSHTQEKALACPTCGVLFANRTRLLDHCRRQEVEQNYACEVCGKTFASPRLLRDHVRSHVNNFFCKFCEMSCTSPSALSSHVKYRHCDEKPFQCPLCPYAAKSQSDVTRHTKSHAQTFLTCDADDCNYRAKTLTAMNYHHEKVHSETKSPRYQCHECQKLYHRGNILTKHLTKVHKLVWPAGHTRFRYGMLEGSNYFTLMDYRYESQDVRSNTPQVISSVDNASDLKIGIEVAEVS